MADLVESWLREYDEYIIEHVSLVVSSEEVVVSGECELLPYGCLCTGGGVFHQHRLMRYPVEEESAVQWRSSAPMFRRRMRSDLHFLHTLRYLMTRRAECLGRSDPFLGVGSTVPRRKGNCHHWLEGSPPTRIRLPFKYLVMTRKDLLLKQLALKMKGRPFELEEVERDPATGRWTVGLHQVVASPLNLLVPPFTHWEYALCEGSCEDDHTHVYIGSLTFAVEEDEELNDLSRSEWLGHHWYPKHVRLLLRERVPIDSAGQERLDEMESPPKRGIRL